jgi:hypothetical protein
VVCGVALMVLPSLIVGNELLILGGGGRYRCVVPGPQARAIVGYGWFCLEWGDRRGPGTWKTFLTISDTDSAF